VRRKGIFALKPGVELQLLECNNELLLLSVSDSAASLIHKIPKEEWEENLVIEDLQSSQESFSGMIQQYFKTPLN
jgi:flagellar biogenesis protein FliO